MDEQEEKWNLSQIRQRPSRLHAKPIGGVIRKYMAQTGYGQTQSRDDLQAQWAQVVGSELEKVTRPGNVSRGILQVHAANSSVAQELYFLKGRLLSQLQKNLPHLKIKGIKPRVSPLD